LSKKSRVKKSDKKKEQHPTENTFKRDTLEVVGILNQGNISIDSLIKGIKPFVKYYFRFLKKPLTFFQNIDFKNKFIFRNAFTFFVFSLTIYYVLLLPALITNGESVNRFSLYLKTVVEFAIKISIVHLTLKVFGGSGTIKQTFSGYFFSLGFYIPLYALFTFPVYFKLGAENLIYPELNDTIYFVTHLSANDTLWMFYFAGTKFFFGLIALIHFYVFSKVIHEINLFKFVMVYIVSATVRIIIIYLIILPFFSRISPILERLSDLFF